MLAAAVAAAGTAFLFTTQASLLCVFVVIASVADPDPVVPDLSASPDPDPEISPPNPDPDPALVV